MTGDEETLRRAYEAFNARDVEAAVSLMHPEVDWPNAWEGGRVNGRDAVSAYWRRQFGAVSSTVTPERFVRDDEAAIAVTVRQIVRDAATGDLLSDGRVIHRHRLRDGLIVYMDVEEID